MKLILVESPTKSRTIAKFLGKDYKVEASFGHIRDLPKTKMGVDTEKNFEPKYVIPAQAKKRVAELQKVAKGAPEVILATDEDREGEAIAWHLVQALGLEKSTPSSSQSSDGTSPPPYQGGERVGVKRIVFHEITKTAIEEALKNPRKIDMKLVDAQQARRILDRLVGYELSPFLWKKVKAGLSAGRVQSVALRLVAEREREIEKFKAQEYWTIEAKLSPDDEKQTFIAKLHKIEDKALKKFDIKSKDEADKIVAGLQGASYQVIEITEKETKRNPAAPFTTSTLQQDAARKFGMTAKQTMMVAQQLYETGYITYMRTDSVNLADTALRQAQKVIEEKFGKNYVLASPRRYKTKAKGAQEAHEAIRPTDLSVEPGGVAEMDARQNKLYELIWKRTLASQMPEAVFDQTAVDIEASKYRNVEISIFRATGQVMKFDGFIKVYQEGKDEKEEELAEGELPPLHKSQILNLKSLDGVQHFTVPPPRYTDATLVKALEEYGIGRPSTYAPTISTIIQRGYVERLEKKFHPTEIGKVVNDLLVEHFPEIVDYQFTAHMEEELDEIAEGKLEWRPVIKEFYDPFKKHLEEKKITVEKQVEQTDIPCPECGKPMVKKFGRYGQFLACSDYPNCKGTKPLPEEEAAKKRIEAENSGRTCPECNQGELVVRRGKFGHFLGCSRYPDCKYIEKIQKKTDVPCPECSEGELVERRTRKGKTFWGCSRYPACKYATWTFPGKKASDEEKKSES